MDNDFHLILQRMIIISGEVKREIESVINEAYTTSRLNSVYTQILPRYKNNLIRKIVIHYRNKQKTLSETQFQIKQIIQSPKKRNKSKRRSLSY